MTMFMCYVYLYYVNRHYLDGATNLMCIWYVYDIYDTCI